MPTEQWLKDAKRLTKNSAKLIFDELECLAAEHKLDEVWVIEEVIKRIQSIKQKKYGNP